MTKVPSCHKEAVVKVVIVPSTMANTGEFLSTELFSQRLENRQCFLKLSLISVSPGSFTTSTQQSRRRF